MTMFEMKKVEAIKMHLFSCNARTVFTILDGASVPDLPSNLAAFNTEHVCLFRGELDADMAEVAPYLVILEQDAQFTDWVLTNGWGNHWGIFGRSDADLSALRKHFRKFLALYDPAGKSLYFRFYDPRIFKFFLATSDQDDLRDIFGPVSIYIVQEAEPSVITILDAPDGYLRENCFMHTEKVGVP